MTGEHSKQSEKLSSDGLPGAKTLLYELNQDIFQKMHLITMQKLCNYHTVFAVYSETKISEDFSVNHCCVYRDFLAGSCCKNAAQKLS